MTSLLIASVTARFFENLVKTTVLAIIIPSQSPNKLRHDRIRYNQSTIGTKTCENGTFSRKLHCGLFWRNRVDSPFTILRNLQQNNISDNYPHPSYLLGSIFIRANYAYFVPLVMPVQNICDGLECTKLCLAPRIIKHLEEEGFLPALLSPCKYTPGARFWSWVNRYEGDLVVVNLDATEHPHLNTRWKVSICFWS